jgi:hypothetical protein
MNIATENMARMLKDQPLITTSWKCRANWHIWEKFSEPVKHKDRYGDDILVQKRHCIHCNKADYIRLKFRDSVK